MEAINRRFVKHHNKILCFYFGDSVNVRINVHHENMCYEPKGESGISRVPERPTQVGLSRLVLGIRQSHSDGSSGAMKYWTTSYRGDFAGRPEGFFPSLLLAAPKQQVVEHDPVLSRNCRLALHFFTIHFIWFILFFSFQDLLEIALAHGPRDNEKSSILRAQFRSTVFTIVWAELKKKEGTKNKYEERNIEFKR